LALILSSKALDADPLHSAATLKSAIREIVAEDERQAACA
jgi:hypothetical protein